MGWRTRTEGVLSAVLAERERQVARYGHNQDIEDGTGPSTSWLQPLNTHPAEAIEAIFRQDYQDFEDETGKPTWVHLVREEIAEAFKETDPHRLAEELTQVAALCVSWVEKIHDRVGAPLPSKSVESLGLSARARNVLQRNGIETLDDLCLLSYDDLFDLRGLGFRTADEITAALQREGRTLRQNKVAWT